MHFRHIVSCCVVLCSELRLLTSVRVRGIYAAPAFENRDWLFSFLAFLSNKQLLNGKDKGLYNEIYLDSKRIGRRRFQDVLKRLVDILPQWTGRKSIAQQIW